jgi:hypothetical protein
MLDQMEPEPGQLTLLSHSRVGQPDRRPQVALAQDQHLRVDLVGLAGRRRQALHLLRVCDLDVSAFLLERVMDETGTGHRLDHGADRLCVYLVDSSRKRSQRVEVRGDGELIEVLSLIVQKTDLDLASTEIQPGMQH